jgi:dTDP-glucose 4,6-dehydratase
LTTYCILGGGGSFGIHTAWYLLDHGAEKVVGIGRSPLRPEPFSLNIDKQEGYEYRAFHVGHELDLLLEYLNQLCPDVIVNFAAQGEGAASWRHSWRFFDTNATALVRLYEALSERDYPSRFIHIGTSELYGSVEGPAAEDAPIVASSPYSASKAAFDLYLLAMMKQCRGPRTTILRPCNCYCSGQLLHRLVPRAIVAGLTGQKLPLHGGGTAKKSYMHAIDLARAIHMVAEEWPHGKVFNLGPPEPISIREIAEMCAAAVGKDLDEVFEIAPERLGQDSQYWLDSSAIREAVGWEPQIDWPEGLREVYQWAHLYLDELKDWPTSYTLRA